MTQPFVGEIRMFGGQFAPAGWAMCQGATISISQNEPLFTLIGTTYGGDGTDSFQLPDLAGRLPVHQDPSGAYVIASTGGVEKVTLDTSQLPVHNHSFQCAQSDATSNMPGAGVVPGISTDLKLYTDLSEGTAQMNADSLTSSGGGEAHENMMPYLAVTFIIALFGIYPS